MSARRREDLPAGETTHVAAGFSTTSERYDETVLPNAMGARRLVASLPDEVLPRALDVGCGTGFASLELVERRGTTEVIGVDPSAGMLDAFRAKLASHPEVSIELREATAEDMDVPPASVDIAISTMAFHWFEDPFPAAAGMVRAVRPGGLVAALAPAWGADREFFVAVERIDPPAPREWLLAETRFLIDPDQLEAAFRATGVDVLDVWIEERQRSASPDQFLERMRTVATHVFLRTPGYEEAELEDAWRRTEAEIRAMSGPRGFEWVFKKVFLVARVPE